VVQGFFNPYQESKIIESLLPCLIFIGRKRVQTSINQTNKQQTQVAFSLSPYIFPGKKREKIGPTTHSHIGNGHGFSWQQIRGRIHRF
jgi:hypothetical protein